MVAAPTLSALVRGRRIGRCPCHVLRASAVELAGETQAGGDSSHLARVGGEDEADARTIATGTGCATDTMHIGIAIAGGMFVVPLYAFLTTFVPKTETARTIAANSIVNSGAMVVGSLIATGLSAVGLDIVHHLLLSAGMCLMSAYLGLLLLRAERAALA